METATATSYATMRNTSETGMTAIRVRHIGLEMVSVNTPALKRYTSTTKVTAARRNGREMVIATLSATLRSSTLTKAIAIT